MLTKKDYKMIAGVIANKDLLIGIEAISKHELITELSRVFKKDNPNFDAAKFMRACYPKAETEPK